MQPSDRARVVYIGESPVTARGFEDILTRAGHELLLSCRDPDADLSTINGFQPTLIIIGTLTPSYRAFTLCRELAGRWRRIPIIMTTRTPDDDLLAADAYDAGASAWMDLRLDLDAQVEIIERVLAGATLFTRRQLQLVSSVEDLTPRQRNLLKYLSQSQRQDAGEAALDLGVAANTVRNHLAEIRSRLGVHTTADAIDRARRRGLV